MAGPTRSGFDDWLRRYGEAWEARSAEAAVRLFSEHADYHWTPLEEPKRGRQEIAAAYAAAVARQREVRFRYRVLAVDGDIGIAHWHAELVRPDSGRAVETDGILVARFDDSGLCTTFREWWHSTDPASAAATSSAGREPSEAAVRSDNEGRQR